MKNVVLNLSKTPIVQKISEKFFFDCFFINEKCITSFNFLNQKLIFLAFVLCFYVSSKNTKTKDFLSKSENPGLKWQLSQKSIAFGIVGKKGSHLKDFT